MNLNDKTKPKFLFVDDRPANLLALKVIVDDPDYECFEASSGAAAIELSRQHRFAAILLDVQMPIMDGFETAKHLRAERPDIPIIFVTAILRDDHFANMGYLAGAVDYLFKPIDAQILKAKLSVFAELYRKSEENLKQSEIIKHAALREQEHQLLKAALQARDEFLSMAAHELKTPITPLYLQMDGFLKMFRDGSYEKVERERLIRMLQTSKSQVERLSRLINDLVDLSRIKSGRIELHLEKVNLLELVEGIALAFAEEAKRAKCDLQVTGEGSGFGNWDRFRIEQVCVNLLTNAIKYGPGKPIRMKVSTDECTATMEIEDNGIGIDPIDQERIFDRFERAVSPLHYGGLGLGLFISKQIVQMHGGDIQVESRPNEGAKFRVTLPTCPA